MIRRKVIADKNIKYIMTNDPSLTGWGWAIIDPSINKVVDVGLIETKPTDKKLRIRKGDDRIRRLSEITDNLLRVIRKYDIKYILSELPHGSQNAQAAFALGSCAAIILTLSISLGMGLEWYSENDAKKAVSNRQIASKEEMVYLISQMYSVNWFNTKKKDAGVADAIAIYHVAKIHSEVLKFFTK